MVRHPIRISLPMFWTWASSKNFYKIIKSFNRTVEMGQYSNHFLDDMLLMGRMLQEIFMERDTLIFLFQHWVL